MLLLSCSVHLRATLNTERNSNCTFYAALLAIWFLCWGLFCHKDIKLTVLCWRMLLNRMLMERGPTLDLLYTALVSTHCAI